MAGRHLVLAVGAVLVLGLGAYLFVAVHAGPALPPTVATRTTPVPGIGAASAPMGQLPPSAAPGSAPPDAVPVAPAVPGLEAAASDGSDGDGAGSGSAPPAFAYSDDKLQSVMAEANRAYDRGDFDEARTIAGRVLIRQPSNARMLRILVSSSCVEGDAAAAQASVSLLPAEDQERMRIRCARYGINLTTAPAK